jgi:hypothetical protein
LAGGEHAGDAPVAVGILGAALVAALVVRLIRQRAGLFLRRGYDLVYDRLEFVDLVGTVKVATQ